MARTVLQTLVGAILAKRKSSKMKGNIRIGTSGWNYRHWFDRFYPKKLPQPDLLSFYADYFDTVEINNSFYKLPTFQAFRRWRHSVPDSFVFAVKASRFITHMKKLKAPKASSTKLFNRMKRLSEKLGPILFQLPPDWHCNRERLAKFLKSLSPERRYAFEFRDSSWLKEEIFDLLKEHNTAFCIHDFRGEQSPKIITADFTYVRMHGPRRAAYSGSYPPRILKKWAQQIEDWREKLSDVYVYFNNDAEGHAVWNALKLKELCD
jgi:uncharacterized protein YecE (DUF72 family)